MSVYQPRSMRAAPLRRPTPLGFAVVVVAVAWTLGLAAVATGHVLLPSWRGAGPLLPAVLPLGAAAMLLTRRDLPRAVTLAAWWMVLAYAALLAAVRLDSQPLLALAVPTLAISAFACLRRPAAAIVIAFAVTGAYGSLVVFLGFPTESTVNLVLGSMWVGIPASYLLARRTWTARHWLPLAGVMAFVAVTLIQMLAAPTGSGATGSFLAGTWFMTAVIVLAYAPWRPQTFRRIAQGMLVVAVLVGAYATLRWIVGPDDKEAAVARLVSYNYSGTKLKLLGSFPNGSDLGQWAAALIPFCCAAMLWMRGVWRVLGITAMALLAIAMLGSQLRIGLPAATIGSALVVVLWQSARSFPALRLGTTAMIVVLAIAAGVGAFAVTGGSSDPKRSYSNILDPGNDPSIQARTYKWSQALRDLDNRPLGYGLGSATSGIGGPALQTSRFRLNVGRQSIDSGYLKVALEQGFGVMVLFAGGLLLLLGGMARRAVSDTDPQRAGLLIGAAGTLAAFLVLLVTGAFQEALAASAVWLIVGIGAAQAIIRRPA